MTPDELDAFLTVAARHGVVRLVVDGVEAVMRPPTAVIPPRREHPGDPGAELVGDALDEKLFPFARRRAG